MPDVAEWDDPQITDEELTALALAGDPDAPLDDDAVPLQLRLSGAPELLPSWYMPPPGGITHSRRKAAVVVLVIAALLIVNAVGLCVTSGRLEIPFR